MANPAINFAGFLYDDAGDAISGATINLYDKNTSTTSRASTTTDSNGAWSIAHTTAGEFDIQVTSGSSKRRIKFDDKVHLSELDAETINVRGNNGAAAPLYFFSDQGDDAGDRWLFNAAAGGVFTMGNDIHTQGTYVAHVTITPNSTVASSTFAIAGLATIAGKLTLSDGFAVGSDAGGDILYSNGTKYIRLARGSDGDVLTLASSIPSWATPTTGDITGVTAGDGLSGGGTSGGVTLALDLNELTAAAVADGDFIPIIDTNDSNGSRKEAVHDLATLFAGAGMTATSSVLNVIGGDGITANSNDVAITAAQTTVTSVYNASLKMGRDSQNLIDFATTDNKIILRVNNVDEVELVQNAISPVTSDGVALGTGSLMWSDLFVASGGVINFNNGDVALTHSSNTVTLSGGDLALTDASVQIDSSPADETVSGITATFTAGETLVRGEVVYFKQADSKMWKAVATAAATSNCVAMAAEDITGDAAGKFLLQGFCTDNGTFPDYSASSGVGKVVYTPEAETSSQNVPEKTAPDTDGDFVQIIGYVVSANTLYFNPNSTIVEVS